MLNLNDARRRGRGGEVTASRAVRSIFRTFAYVGLTLPAAAVAQNESPIATDQALAMEVDVGVQVVLQAMDPDDGPDPVSALILTPPSNGSLVREGNVRYRYMPDPGFSGVDSVLWAAFDGELQSSPATLSLIVHTRPVASDQVFSTYVEKPLPFALAASDDGLTGPLTYEIVRSPAKGVLVPQGSGLYRYVPSPGERGADSFTWRAHDGDLFSIPNGLVDLTIEDYPVILLGIEGNPIDVVLGEEEEISGAFTIKNDGGGTLSWNIEGVTGPLFDDLSSTSGTLLGGEAEMVSFSASPAGLGEGTYPSTVTVVDPIALNTPATLEVELIISPPNQAPVAEDQSVPIETETDVQVPLQVIDPDDGPEGLFATVLNPPSNGTFSREGNLRFRYTPDPGFAGIDTVVWSANDGDLDSNEATLEIAVHDRPIASDQAFALYFDQPVAIVLDAVDEGLPEPMTYEIVRPPSKGVLTEEGVGMFRYTPNPDERGGDSFTWRAHDGDLFSVPNGLVDLTINEYPVILLGFEGDPIDAVLGEEEVSGEFTIKNDGGGTLEWSVEGVTGPLFKNLSTMNGTLSGGEAEMVSFTTPLTGLDEGTYLSTVAVGDPIALNTSATLEVTLILSPPNQAPVAEDQTIAIEIDTDVQVPLEVVDVDEGPGGRPGGLFATVVTPPSNGTFTREGNLRFRYTPDLGFVGTDKVTWSATDGDLDSNEATLQMVVHERPIVSDQAFAMYFDQPVVIALDAVDEGLPEPMTYEIVRPPAKGVLTEEGVGVFLYTPNPGERGADSFTWRAIDGHLVSIPNGLVTLAIDDYPQVQLGIPDPTIHVILGEEEISGTFTVKNDGGGTLSWSVADLTGPIFQNLSAMSGTLDAGTAETVTYTGNIGDLGEGEYLSTVKVVDPIAPNSPQTLQATLVLSVVNKAPLADDQSIVIEPDVDTQVLLQAVDPDSGPEALSAVILEPPANGSFVREGNMRFRYTPNPGFAGLDRVIWAAFDGELESLPAMLDIVVHRRPIATDQSFDLYFDQTVAISLDATDDDLPEGITYEIVRNPAKGTLTEEGAGLYRYTPNAGELGADSFTWRAYDGDLYSVPNGSVSVSIEEYPKILITSADEMLSGFVGDPSISGTFTITNTGGGVLNWSVSEVSGPAFESLSPSGGALGAGEVETVSFSSNLEALSAGAYYSTVTLVDPVAENSPQTFETLLFLSSGDEDLGFVDLVDIAVLDTASGQLGGTARFVSPPGDEPLLEVNIDDDVAQARLLLTFREPTGPREYLQFDLLAATGTAANIFLVADSGVGESYRLDAVTEALHTDWERHHIVVDDFVDDGTLDLDRIDQLKFRIDPVPEGFLGASLDEARTLYIDNFRISMRSVDIQRAVDAGPANVVVDRGVDTGITPRPWEGIVGVVDREGLLTQMGIQFTRMGAFGLDDWEGVATMFAGVDEYDFSPVDDLYRRAEDMSHYPWIPTIPYFLWQVQDPDILIDDIPWERPKYAFMPPSNYADWEHVVADFVRYHSESSYDIRGFSILNEPNGNESWAGTDEEAREFFVRTGAAVKAADPSMEVVGPNYGGFHPVDMQAFLDHAAAGEAPLDVMAWHYYFRGRRPDRVFDQAALARAMLSEYSIYDQTRLAINEWGYALRVGFEERSRRSIAAAAMAEMFSSLVDAEIELGIFFNVYPSRNPSVFVSSLFDFDRVSARPTLYTLSLFGDLGATGLASATDQEEHGVRTLAAVDEETGTIDVLVWWHMTGTGFENEVKPVQLFVGDLPWREFAVERFEIPSEVVVGKGYEPLVPVDSLTEIGPTIRHDFALPLYGVTLVRLTPLGNHEPNIDITAPTEETVRSEGVPIDFAAFAPDLDDDRLQASCASGKATAPATSLRQLFLCPGALNQTPVCNLLWHLFAAFRDVEGLLLVPRQLVDCAPLGDEVLRGLGPGDEELLEGRGTRLGE